MSPRLLLAGVALAPLRPGCDASRGCRPGTGRGTAAGRIAEHVVAISVDGLNPRALSMLTPAEIPGFTRLARDGASTLNARTVVETHPDAAEPHLDGHQPPGAGARGTGVTFNEDPGTTVHDSAGEYVPSVFDVVHDAGLRTGLFATKTKFAFLDRSWNAVNGAPDETGADDGRNKVDVFRVVDDLEAGDDPVAAAVRGRGRRRRSHCCTCAIPTAPATPTAGCRGPYLQAVRDADSRCCACCSTWPAHPGCARTTVVIVTSDHGGNGTSHSDTTLLPTTGCRSSYGARASRPAPTSTRSTPTTGATRNVGSRPTPRPCHHPQRRGGQPGARSARAAGDPHQPDRLRPGPRRVG